MNVNASPNNKILCKLIKYNKIQIFHYNWHTHWIINSADLMFDRTALFNLRFQLLFNVPDTDSKENIDSAPNDSSDGRAID